MGQAIQLIRSMIFNISIYIAMAVIALVYFPLALLSADWARYACKLYCRWVIWSASWMIGLKTEIRGTPPTGPTVIAAKHQSFYDILVIFNAVPRGRFIAKQELKFAPFLGQYAQRIGTVFVNRGKRGQAIEKMLRDVASGHQEAGQLIIYPQGTRVAPGAKRPYKIGTGLIYEQLQQPCVPVATNIGVFWPKRGFMRNPGTAVVEFLPEIPVGMDKSAFIEKLETDVESRSDALMADAGFRG